MDNETRDLAVKREDGLLAMAIEKGISDPDILAKLIALRNDELARQSKAVFDENFAAMQAEFVPVGKSSKATDANGRTLYSYCPIEVILAMAAPIMARHGFSYRWTEEALANKEKRINCIVSGWGHSETGYVDIPFMEPSSRATNAVQMRGSATTYGKRYSFLNATGIIVGGEDNDALSNSTPGAVKVDIVPDEPEGIRVNVSNQFGPLPPSADPLEAVKTEIKAEIATFVARCGAQFEGVDYFTDEEKATFKGMIAAINEGARAEKDVAKGLAIKLADMKKLNEGLASELDARKGNTGLAKEMKVALAEKNGAAPQQELY